VWLQERACSSAGADRSLLLCPIKSFYYLHSIELTAVSDVCLSSEQARSAVLVVPREETWRLETQDEKA
jgi:hypothetical protein